MLKYLIIQLDDISVSFCHYKNYKTNNKLIDLNFLKEAVFWSMKENLSIQFVYPDYELPKEYKNVIDTIEHADIVSASNKDETLRKNADIVVFNDIKELSQYDFIKGQGYIVKTTLLDLFKEYHLISAIFPKVNRINVVITDLNDLGNDEQNTYDKILTELSQDVYKQFQAGHPIYINLLTDRIFLEKMNNCNAGDEVITVAPDGKFYVCPAFYLYEEKDEGNLQDGLKVRNPQLYKYTHAPICRKCDAYQCKRCIWLNKQLTLEVNTPSHEQCVISHIEREQSRKLLNSLRKLGTFMPGTVITKLNYLDPFDKLLESK